MKLYGYFRSSAAYRVRIAMNLKGVAVEHAYVHLRKGEQTTADYRKLNPQGLVPTLMDGEHALTQSLAIIEYLDERYPNPPLLPEDSAGRAWVRSIAQSIACDIHPLNNLRVLNYLRDELQIDEAGRQRWYQHWIATGLAAVEVLLTARPRDSVYCYGASPTLADLCLVPQVYNAERMSCPLDDYPTVRSIVEACRALPAFRDADPACQPDADA
jgi:maleylpyruvate isomerase